MKQIWDLNDKADTPEIIYFYFFYQGKDASLEAIKTTNIFQCRINYY